MSKEAGYVWNFVAELGNGRQVSVTGNFDKGSTQEEMNAEIDKVRAVLDRQQSKSVLRSASEEVESLRFKLSNAVKDLARIDEKNKDRQLTVAERQQREAAVAHIEKIKEDIDFKSQKVKEFAAEAK